MAALMHNDHSQRPSREERRAGKPRTLVAGLGASGLAAARYLTRLGERVLVVDSRAAPPGLDALKRERPDVPIELGTLDPKWLAGATRVVWSPGLSLEEPLAVEARRRGVEIIGEIELFARAANAPVLAVTGSNGKSTVTALTAHLLAAAGYTAPAGGNLGPPALDLLELGAAADSADVYVLEISSFQMETTESLRPLAAALLNICEDHLDRHADFDRYAALKAKLISSAEYAIFNYDDPHVRTIGERAVRPVPLSIEQPLVRGWSVVAHDGERWLARDGRPLVRAAALALRGRHNEANALAALALTAVLIDVSGGGADALDAALAALPAFAGLAHRCREVAVRRGVAYIDDSKGTNVGATAAAIANLPGPLVLIAGGQGKGADFTALRNVVEGKVKAAVLIGEAADALERALAGCCEIRRAVDMREAVKSAAGAASAGDTVLLSPACASQDMFRDYKHRGEAFEAAVRELPE